MGRRKDLIKPSKEELESKYLIKGSTLSSLAKEYNTSHPTIRSWLKGYGITVKTHKIASTEANNRKRQNIPSRDKLLECYEKYTQKEMEQYFGVGQETIYEWLKQRKIKTRSLSEAISRKKADIRNRMTPSKEEILNVLNSDICCSKHYLAEHFNVSVSFMRNILNNYDIYPNFFRSESEKNLFEFCEDLFLGWRSNDRSLINPFELDMVHDKLKLAIEYCGIYWHSETWGEKDKWYHVNKKNKCLKKGYDLLTIFDVDDENKIKNLIRHRVGLGNRIGARKCELKEINSSTASLFHNEHHLHGTCGASVHLGLYRNNDLVMVGSFGKARYNPSFEWECTRMTNLGVTGGTSKIFKRFGKDSIITYADRRFGEGKVYEKCGFKRLKDAGPNYWYFNKEGRLYSRVAFQKHKLKDKLEKFDPKLTEWQNMRMNGYDRIWDCGNAIYVSNK